MGDGEVLSPLCKQGNKHIKKIKGITFISAEAELIARLGIDRKSEVPKLWDFGAFWCFLHGIYNKQQWEMFRRIAGGHRKYCDD